MPNLMVLFLVRLLEFFGDVSSIFEDQANFIRLVAFDG